jgi:hypothetical protein
MEGTHRHVKSCPDGPPSIRKTPNQQQTSLTQINVVLNWFEELKQEVPVK